MEIDPIDDDSGERAAAYMMACLFAVIPLMPSEKDLREWWKEEEYNRIKYGLSKQQIDELIQACSRRKNAFPQERKFKGFI